MYALFQKWTQKTTKVSFVEINEDIDIKKSILTKLKEDNEGSLFGFCDNIEFINGKNPVKRSFLSFEDYVNPNIFIKPAYPYYDFDPQKSIKIKYKNKDYYFKIYNSLTEEEIRYLFSFWKEKYTIIKKLSNTKKYLYEEYLSIINILEENDYIGNSIMSQIIT
jgi:hypothetical protein